MTYKIKYLQGKICGKSTIILADSLAEELHNSTHKRPQVLS